MEVPNALWHQTHTFTCFAYPTYEPHHCDQIGAAVKKAFAARFPKPPREGAEAEAGAYAPLLAWFAGGNAVTLSDEAPFAEHLAALAEAAGLDPEESDRFLNLLAETAENVVVILSTHIVQDVTDRRQNEDQIRRLANFDSLTKLPNRHQLVSRMERAIEHVERDGRTAPQCERSAVRHRHLQRPVLEAARP